MTSNTVTLATLDIYVRPAGVEIKGVTDCLNFVPSKIDYAENVASLNNFRNGGLQ